MKKNSKQNNIVFFEELQDLYKEVQAVKELLLKIDLKIDVMEALKNSGKKDNLEG